MTPPSLWILLFLIVVTLIAKTFITAEKPIPDLREPFDFETNCDIDVRKATGNDWVQCEDRSGAPASHVLNPLDIMIFTGDPLHTLLVTFVWEAVETGMLTFYGSYVIFEDVDSELETNSGQLLGDAAIQGSIGVLIGWLIVLAARWPGIFSSVYRPGRLVFTRIKAAAFTRLFVLWGINSAIYGLIGITTERYSVGFSAAIVVHLIYNVLVMPLFIRTTDVGGDDLRAAYFRLLPMWVMARLFVGLLGGGLQLRFMRSFYEQTWLAAAIVCAVIFALGANRRN